MTPARGYAQQCIMSLIIIQEVRSSQMNGTFSRFTYQVDVGGEPAFSGAAY